MWGCVWRCMCPCAVPESETPPRTLTDHRGMFNCRLLRPAVIGLICHRARLAGRQEEAGVRGVTPPRDDEHTGAPAKQAAGPVLLLWSLWILLSLSQFQANNITALIEHTADSSMKQTGIFPLEYTTAVCVPISLSFGNVAVLTAPNWRD